jgi:hypothetical protein
LSQQRHHRKKGKLRVDRETKLQYLVDEGKLNWGMREKPTLNTNCTSSISRLSSSSLSPYCLPPTPNSMSTTCSIMSASPISSFIIS